jgi:hypothetical protein
MVSMPNTTPVLKPDLMYSNGKIIDVTDEYWNKTCPVLLEQFKGWAENEQVRFAFARVVSDTFGPSATADLMLYAGIDHGVIEGTVVYLRSIGHKEFVRG